MTKTYVIAGHDHNNAFKGDVEAWEKRAKEKDDVVLIYPQPGQSMKDVANQIKPPANVVLLAHGGRDGMFRWHQNHSVEYAVLFLELKNRHLQGIESITIGSCYGELAVAQRMLDSAPNGTLVQAQNGSKVVGWGDFGQGAREITNREITPLSLLLESLDCVDPKAFNKYAKRHV